MIWASQHILNHLMLRRLPFSAQGEIQGLIAVHPEFVLLENRR